MTASSDDFYEYCIYEYSIARIALDRAERKEMWCRNKGILKGAMEDYVRDLGTVVDGYIASIAEMELPDELIGKDRIVFANVRQIYEFHRDTFQPEIAKCMDDYAIAGSAYSKYERRLHMYVVYCENKPKSEYLVQGEMEGFFEELRLKLGHRLTLPDLLIKPVQRIMKYQLLLKDILKYTQRAEQDTSSLEKAMEVMRVVPKACDDMMHVGRLQGFSGKITAQGKLLWQGTLAVSEMPVGQTFKGKDRRMFLFEQSLICADVIPPKNQFSQPNYIYKCHFMMNKLVLEKTVEGDPRRFLLRSNDPSNSTELMAQCGTEEEKADVLAAISEQLGQLQNFLRSLQNPLESKRAKEAGKNSLEVKPEKVKGKSPILARLAEKVKGKEEEEGEPSKAAPSSTPSPRTKSRLFEGFRNTLKGHKKSSKAT